MKIQVFDPPMCCSTGICGASVDPELVRFTADLAWLERQGVAVEMVKETPARSILTLADKYLGGRGQLTQASPCRGDAETAAPGGKCCG